ncbi:UNVERIFIED_CONTAM: hypothetical protein K2H54_060057 [Gekko kuhli]
MAFSSEAKPQHDSIPGFSITGPAAAQFDSGMIDKSLTNDLSVSALSRGKKARCITVSMSAPMNDRDWWVGGGTSEG